MGSDIATIEINSLTKRQINTSIFIMAVLFFVFGFVTWLNSILIPYFKIACELTSVQSYLVTFSFYISYFVMSVPSSYLLKWAGFKKGMVTGFLIMTVGAFIFVPAAILRSYGIFLLGLFSLGSGLAVLQTAANPYITILGPKERAGQRIAIMGICNKVAGIIAPLILAAVVFKSSDNELIKQIPSLNDVAKNAVLDEYIRRVITPYLFIGGALLGLGLMILFSPLPEINTDNSGSDISKSPTQRKNIFAFPQLILGVVAISLHVGTHVISIDTIIGYAVSMGMSLHEAKVFPSYTLLATTAGYIMGIVVIPKIVSQENVFRISALLGLVLTFFIICIHGDVNFLGHSADISIWLIVLLGLADAMVYAAIWPLALDGLGKYTKLGSSLLIMGLCGQAILPLIYAYIGSLYGLRLGYSVLLPCYLYLIYYSFYGYKIRSWTLKYRRR